MKDPVAKVRRNAAASLGAFRAEAAQIIPVLLERISDDDVEVRRAAIVSLGMLGKGSAPAEEAVAKYLNDPDPQTKMDVVVAAAAMGKRDDAVIPLLVEALGSNEEATVKAARKAVADIGRENPDKIVPSLIDVLKKGDDPAVVNAVRVLGSLRQHAASTAPQLVEVYGKVRAEDRHYVVDALLALDKSGEQTIPILNKSLKSSDPLDRREALLGLMRYRSNVSAILPSVTMAFKDASQENRLLAVGIVRGLGEKARAAFPELLPLTTLPDARMRKAAVGAIGSIRPSDPEAVAALERTIKDKDVGVRMASVYAVRRISAVSTAQVRDQLEKILQTALEQETVPSMKTALKSALLRNEQTPPPVTDHHTKLNESEKKAKTETDPANVKKATQDK